MEKKETYKAPEMKSIVLINQGSLLQESPVAGTAGQIDTVNSYTEEF